MQVVLESGNFCVTFGQSGFGVFQQNRLRLCSRARSSQVRFETRYRFIPRIQLRRRRFGGDSRLMQVALENGNFSVAFG